MGKKGERQNRLLQVLKTQGMQPIRILAEMLSVAEITVRRDLAELGAQHSLELSAALPADSAGYDLLTALQMSYEQKAEIGKLAALLVKPGDVIAIDAGSTTVRMLPFLPENYHLTVLCYTTNVLMELRYKTGVNPLFCGGIYHRGVEMFESPEGIKFIERTRANKAFLSAAGVHRELGVTCANEYEVPTKRAVIQSSAERILVADSSKFNKIKASYFCDLSDIHVVITDRGLSDEWQEHIREKEITLYLV